MTDLMKILYEYAEDYIMRGLLDRESEYSNIRHSVDQQERKLLELVGEENRKYLEDLLEERKVLDFMEGEALFCAGFRVALELTR